MDFGYPRSFKVLVTETREVEVIANSEEQAKTDATREGRGVVVSRDVTVTVIEEGKKV